MQEGSVPDLQRLRRWIKPNDGAAAVYHATPWSSQVYIKSVGAEYPPRTRPARRAGTVRFRPRLSRVFPVAMSSRCICRPNPPRIQSKSCRYGTGIRVYYAADVYHEKVMSAGLRANGRRRCEAATVAMGRMATKSVILQS